MSAVVKISKALPDIARMVDKEIERVAGQRVSFSLFVWTDGRSQYVANVRDREGIKKALLSIISNWDAGAPDVPAHEAN